MSQTVSLFNIGDLSFQPHFGLNLLTEFQLLRIYSIVRNIKLGLVKILVFVDPPVVLIIN